MAIVPVKATVAETTAPPPGAMIFMSCADRLAEDERDADVGAEARR